MRVQVFELVAIGERIAKAREEAGLRQEDLADMIERSTRTVQSYEAGTSSPYRKIREISAVTGRSVEWLLHGDPQDDPPPKDLAGQGLALVLDRLESLEAAVAKQATDVDLGFQALAAGIARLEQRLSDEDRPKQRKGP